jgi:hypothetical protein
MRTLLVVVVLLVGYDGVFQDFKATRNAYQFIDGLFESVTDAM